MAKILISGKIEEPLVHKFIKDYNDSGNQFKDIYINSEGDYHSLGLVIIDIINSAPSKCCIIAAGEVHSTAFEIFFLTTCRKKSQRLLNVPLLLQ